MTTEENTNVNEHDDSFGKYLSPEEFAQNLFDQGEFVVLVWDSQKYRLGQRISELMKLGYRPLSGTVQSHTVYQETSKGSGNRIPVKQDLCILMLHEGLFKQFHEIKE